AKFCRGFRDVVVTMPHSSGPWLRRCSLPGNARIELCRDYRDDYLGQQVTKLLADTFTDADYICHIDSDCIFSRPTAPEDLIVDGMPRVLMRPSHLLGRHWPWVRPTEQFLGWRITGDYMQRPPFTFPRWLYPELREHAAAMHGLDIETYITAQPPRGFSEYNALGAFAWRHHRERFVWIDTSTAFPGDPHCRWYWSWGGIDRETRAEIENILDEDDGERAG